MEFMIVVFPEMREIIVDDVASGRQPGDIIEIEAGHHVISLTGETDYKPDQHEILIENTSVLDPVEVRFEKE